MSELLQKWATLELGSLNEFVSKTIDPSKFPDEVFELYSVPSFPDGRPEILNGSEIGSTKQEVRPNDVLVCKINPRINRVWRVGQYQNLRQIASSEWIVVRTDHCDAAFLRHYFSSPNFRDFLCEDVTGVGGSLTRAQPKRVSKSLIPVAPLNEQERIADKLDSLLARVDACRERLDRIPTILKRLRQSILAAACSGKLTGDWRVANGLSHPGDDEISVDVAEPYSHRVKAPGCWQQRNLGDICEFVGGSQPQKSTFQYQDGPGLIRLIQIRDYKSDKHVTFIPKSLAKRFCSATDIMIGRYGPPIFQILRGLEGAYNVALMKAVPDTQLLDPEYLYYLLRGEALLRYVEAGSDRTAGQDGVRKELLYPYPVFLPSIAEQTEIANRVAKLLAFTDHFESRLRLANARVAELTPSMLGCAFRGELVPQDPNDEPAEELLSRISRATVSDVSKPREKKSGKRISKKQAVEKMLKRADVQSNHLTEILRSHGPLTAEALWSLSQLEIDDFYDQLKAEEEKGLLKEHRKNGADEVRLLEVA